MTLPLQNKFALLNSLSDSSSSDEESTFVITRRRDNASEQERDTRRKAAAAAEAAKETRRVMTDAERKAASAKKSRLTFEHHTHDGNLLVVADLSLLDFNSQITTTTTKSAKHLRTLNNAPVAAAVASPSSSGIDAFDAVKDAERKAKNAASAKKSRQKKNQIEATRDKQVEEMKTRNQKLDKKINKTKQLINAMSSLVLDVKLQNLFGDSTTPTNGTTSTNNNTTFSPEHGSFYQQMEQETNATSGMPHYHDVVDEVARVPVFNLPLFDLLNVTSTATSQKEEEVEVVVNESNAVIKATDETQYSEEEAPLEMQQNDQSCKLFFIDSGIE